MGGRGFLDYSKLKVPSSGQLFIFGRLGVILDYSKLKVPNSGQLFIWGGGGRVFLTTQNSKSQVLTKSLLGGGGILDY